MNPHSDQYSTEELIKLLKRERTAFLKGLENDASIAELELIQARIKSIDRILDDREKKDKKR